MAAVVVDVVVVGAVGCLLLVVGAAVRSLSL